LVYIKARVSIHVAENTLIFVTYYLKHRRFTTAIQEKSSEITLLEATVTILSLPLKLQVYIERL
jgi:hypothetical protein